MWTWGAVSEAGAVFRYYSGYPITETIGQDANGYGDSNDRPIADVHDPHAAHSIRP
jgi:hypothetical protein